MIFRKIFRNFVLFSLVLGVATSSSLAQANPRQEKLLNNLKILMWSDAKADKVTVKVRIHSGSAFDPQGKEGVMKLLADNIFPNKAARELFVEDLGGSLDVVNNYDYIQINATSKPDQFLTMLETIANAVSNPMIDKETTAKLRTEQIERVKELEKDPAYVADMAAAKRLFGTFPYGRPAGGTNDSLVRIDFADLIDAKQRFLTADNATVAISGNFDQNLAYRALRRYFGSWLKSDKKTPSTFRQPDAPEASAQMIVSPVPNNFEIRYIARGYARNDKDLPESQVLAQIIEGRIKAKIPAEYRSGIHVRSEGHILPGAIMIGMSGMTSASTESKIEANDLVSAAIQTKITDAEFNAAKAAFTAEWNGRDMTDRWLDLDTYKTVAVAAEQQTVVNLTTSDVQRAADALSKQPVAVVVLTKPKESN